MDPETGDLREGRVPSAVNAIDLAEVDLFDLRPGTHPWIRFALWPRRNNRVQVSRDPALDRAIRRGRAAMGPSTPTSKVLRELALRGAEAFESDEAAERRAEDFALSVADGASGLDLERLRTVRERAWDRRGGRKGP